ncbi:MAG: tRNA lysidine(34) synthetase TilS [Candidatus Eremiobacteraeota bacterium]|nr:tRNA lysidine(34) synthetase TilS [Candidatus Eremiobacteraeota bacterium]
MRGAKPQRALELAILRNQALRDGVSILIACSGGPDSVALAALMRVAAEKRRWTLTIAHVNHGLRRSADQDEAVVLHVAAALQLTVKTVQLRGVDRDESSLRNARYAALQRIAKDVGAQTVVTGHTAEDQTETVLLALFRGTGTNGLTGMAECRRLALGIELCRPLLRETHAELQRYCQAACLPYALDPTNEDLKYRRNAVRSALGVLRGAFPGLDRAVARAAYIAAQESADAPRTNLRRRVRAALNESGQLQDIDFEHIESAVRALESGRSGTFHASRRAVLHVGRGQVTVKER